MSRKPHPKVAAGTTAAATAILITWTLAQFGVEMPAEAGAALATVLGAIFGYLKAAA